MKNITKITGCALAAVLMTVAASSQAANNKPTSGKIVVDNTLYSPINFKVQVNYVDSKGKIKKATETSKNFLKDLGFNDQVSLCLGEDQHVYVVNKKNGQVVDVSAIPESGEGDTNAPTIGMWVNANELISTDKTSGNNGSKYSYESEGQITVDFTGNTSQFHLEGLYSAKLNNNTNDKKGTQNVKTSAKSMNLSGTANTDMGSGLPASGTANGGGDGTLTTVE